MPYPDSKYPPAPQGQAPSDTFAAMEKRHIAGLTERDLRSRRRLMAAAPELLEALKELVEKFEEAVDWVPEYVEMADRSKAAIAKAEGRG